METSYWLKIKRAFRCTDHAHLAAAQRIVSELSTGAAKHKAQIVSRTLLLKHNTNGQWMLLDLSGKFSVSYSHNPPYRRRVLRGRSFSWLRRSLIVATKESSAPSNPSHISIEILYIHRIRTLQILWNTVIHP
jgi:hypothetical protein